MIPFLSWARLRGFCERRAARPFFRRIVPLRPEIPLISFSFDDFPRSALRNGGAILKDFGLTGTYYASLGLAGTDTPSGRIFDLDDLTDLLEQGHELGCHTFAHYNSWNTATRVFEGSLVQNRAAIQKLVPDFEFQTFSYPITSPRPWTKGIVGRRFRCSRAAGQSLNVGRMDLNQMAAFFLEKSRDNMQAVRNIIDENRRNRGWLIFATHDVADHPTPFGCNPKFFEEVVQYSVDSGARIVPVVDALAVALAPATAFATTSGIPAISAQGSTMNRQRSPEVGDEL